jgi:hypothetical protein
MPKEPKAGFLELGDQRLKELPGTCEVRAATFTQRIIGGTSVTLQLGGQSLMCWIHVAGVHIRNLLPDKQLAWRNKIKKTLPFVPLLVVESGCQQLGPTLCVT